MDDINNITMHFAATDRKYTLEESREYIVRVTETFLNQINSDEKIRPYLSNYPFTPKNLDLSLTFVDHNKKLDSNYIALVYAIEGKILYSVDDPAYQYTKDIHSESYDEALKIINENKFIHCDSPCEDQKKMI